MRISLFIFLLLSVCVQAQTLVLCDKEAGAAYLSQDPTDGYYNMVNPLEIAIQLKNDTLHTVSEEEAIARYRASYADEVLDMTDDEKTKVTTIMNECIEKVNALNDRLLTDTIRMIMVKGDHYGISTFFTRGDAIAFSKQSLNNMPDDALGAVMFHELSHIISRYNTALKNDLYKTFGFEEMEKPAMMLTSFERQVLYNPDGVAARHYIELMIDDKPMKFVPIISTTAHAYNPKAPTFFQYLHFQLYPLDDMGDVYFVRDPAACESLDYKKIMAAYFGRITNNTQYIIHPDEILADNFLYLFRSEEENEKLDQDLHGAIKQLYTDFK